MQAHEWHPDKQKDPKNMTTVAEQRALDKLAAAKKEILELETESKAQRLAMVNLSSENAQVTKELPDTEAELLELRRKNAEQVYDSVHTDFLFTTPNHIRLLIQAFLPRRSISWGSST